MKEIITTKYIADDGKEFADYRECQRYEENLRFEYSEAFERIPHRDDEACSIGFTYRYSQDDILRVVKVDTSDVLRAVNKYMETHGFDPADLLTTDDIGTIQIFWNWDNNWNSAETFRIGTPKEWKENLCAEVDDWIKKMMDGEHEWWKAGAF